MCAARRVASARNDAFKFNRRGEILWRDEEIARLNRLVNDVLDFARPIRFECAPTDINTVCTEAVRAERVVAAEADRFREARIVALSTGNVYPLVPVAGDGAREEDAPAPAGEYAWSCLGRERVLEHQVGIRQRADETLHDRQVDDHRRSTPPSPLAPDGQRSRSHRRWTARNTRSRSTR